MAFLGDNREKYLLLVQNDKLLIRFFWGQKEEEFYFLIKLVMLPLTTTMFLKSFLLTWLGTAVALLITAQIVPGFIIKTFVAALLAAIVIGLVNATIRPVLRVLTFPATLLTFGLFTFVVNALTLWLASAITPGYGFIIRGFIPAFFGSIVLSIVSSIINYFLRAVE
ncbi:hypothetical protein B6N60_01518 [Richelia sinica FACHB-800]|uniref:Phage holin family protein n=1 Tax=Richelia sinica FACHB-800 TaxID=1357546 RepID=A0A975T7D4_9NOST|nr:hypothetical protein B6N60_01518 [Richelia sinica FACHB-800]